MIYFKDLNAYDKLLICNGCKPGWMPDWINADLIFECDCNQHDVDYFAGGLEADRLEADKRFFESMKASIKKSKLGWSKKWLLRRAAKAYYKLVRQFGDDTFSYRSKRNSEGKIVSYKLTSCFSLPSYSPEVDYRFNPGREFGNKKTVKFNNRWYLETEYKPN